MFENEADLRKLVSRLEIDARPNPAHCTALRRQMLAAFEETRRVRQPSILSADTWRTISDSKITKVAAAAVIVFAALIALKLLIGPPEPPVTPLQAQLSRIKEMYEVHDVNGLVAMLAQAEFDAQVLAAKYLGQIGDARALPALKRLYLLAEENPPAGYDKNPFAEPIEKIKARLAPPVEEIQPKPDANETATIDVPSEDEGVLELLVVHKETGEPLDGVKLDIKIQRQGPDDKRRQATDEQGRCRIEIGDLKTNRIEIRATKDHFVPLEVKFSKDEYRPRIVLPPSYTAVLEPGTSIGGFVQNEQGVPIENASVHLRASAERVWIVDRELKTDANGFWLCDIVPPKLDDVAIRLTHPDYVDDGLYGLYSARPKPSIPELRRMTCVMVMIRGVDVVGSVVDLDGKPIEGATVSQGPHYYPKYPRTNTDPNGRFIFPHSSPGEMILTVLAKGYAPDLKEITVHDDIPPVEFRLGPAQTIRGQVVDSNDDPIEHVKVRASAWRGRFTLQWQAETDAAGRFEWNEAPKDQVGYNFSKEGYMSILWLALSPSPEEVIIEMYPALRVTGKVVDSDTGKPVKDFRLVPGLKWEGRDRVSWQRDSAAEFANGSYRQEFKYQRDGYLVRIEADGYLPGISRVFNADEGDVVYDFNLNRGMGSPGAILLPDGTPAAGAEVIVCTPTQPGKVTNGKIVQREYAQVLEVQADGGFYLPPQTDPYLLAAVHEQGYAQVTDEDFAAEPNITIQPWGCVEGILRIGTEVAANEQIRSFQQDQRSPNLPSVWYDSSTVTNADGYFVLEKLPPGKVRIAHVIKFGRTSAGYGNFEVVDVRAGETASISIGGNGRPVVGRVAVPPDYNQSINWAYGRHTLSLKQPEAPTPEDFNEMTEDQRRSWRENWELSAEGKEFKTSLWENRRTYGVHIEHDGTFRVEDVLPGTYDLRVIVHERPSDKPGWMGELIAYLNHQLHVPDVNEANVHAPLDVGVLQIDIKKRLRVGDRAPQFQSETFDGKKINLADYRGQVVLLNFWSTKYPSGTEELLEADEAYSAFSKDQRIVMIAIALGDDVEAARKFVNDNDLQCVNCFLTRDTAAIQLKDYDVTQLTEAMGYKRLSFPFSFVIGPEGKILARNPSLMQLQSLLEDALRPK